MLKRGGLGAGRGLAVDERQVDRPVGVGVRDRRSDARVDDLERDLLAALARKRLAGRLARLDLAADELPVSAERLAERTLAEEIFVAAADYPADDCRATCRADACRGDICRRGGLSRRRLL